MRGTMMDFPLTLPTILERAGKIFGRVEIVLRRPARSITRSCYREFYRRARRLASALTKLGMQPGDCVASMMWNHGKHLEASASGSITSYLPSLLATRIAMHSRVYSSISVNIGRVLPSCVIALTKS